MDREVRRGGSQDHSADRCRQCQGLRAHEAVRHQGINDDEVGISLDIYLVTGFVGHIFYSMRHEETIAQIAGRNFQKVCTAGAILRFLRVTSWQLTFVSIRRAHH
jgi:hypothetical protein